MCGLLSVDQSGGVVERFEEFLDDDLIVVSPSLVVPKRRKGASLCIHQKRLTSSVTSSCSAYSLTFQTPNPQDSQKSPHADSYRTNGAVICAVDRYPTVCGGEPVYSMSPSRADRASKTIKSLKYSLL